MAQSGLKSDFAEELEASLDRSSLDMPQWAIANFKNPKRPSEPWSFLNHEYQIEILAAGDDVQSVDIEKSAQVGCTVLEIVWMLTWAALHDSMKIAYVLPTAKFAQEFAQLRIDPLIQESPRIVNLMSSEADSKTLKKVGTCFVLFKGTSGEAQAISTDLDAIICDELSYCNQKVLSTYQSRLQHSDLKLERYFSTPLLPGHGISKRVEVGSLGTYQVKCNHCEKWSWPNFMTDLRGKLFNRWLDSVQKTISDLRPEDIIRLEQRLQDHDNDIYLACQHCGKSLEAALRMADRREWVHERLDLFLKGRRSYRVRPFDVPRYNPTQEVLLSMSKYLYSDWINMRMGLSYASAENSFIQAQLLASATIRPVPISVLMSGSWFRGRPLFIGADLGKTNHIVIGVEGDSGLLEIICMTTINTRELAALYGEAHFGKWLFDLFCNSGAVRMVIDSAPSYEPALYCVGMLPIDTTFGAYYVQRGTGRSDIYLFKEGNGVVNICRTEHFTEFAGECNAGKVKLPSQDNLREEILPHFDALKLVKTMDSKGALKEAWDNNGADDHYCHAAGYCWAAFSSLARRFTGAAIAPPVTVQTVRMK